LEKKLQTMHNKYKGTHDEHLAYTPYAIPNVAMANYTTYNDKNVIHLCIKCYQNKNNAQNVAYISYQPPFYITTLMAHGVGVWHFVMLVCMASYMIAGYGHANHAF
jgi:hypothetical protein